jgi:hypothetical protein
MGGHYLVWEIYLPSILCLTPEGAELWPFEFNQTSCETVAKTFFVQVLIVFILLWTQWSEEFDVFDYYYWKFAFPFSILLLKFNLRYFLYVWLKIFWWVWLRIELGCGYRNLSWKVMLSKRIYTVHVCMYKWCATLNPDLLLFYFKCNQYKIIIYRISTLIILLLSYFFNTNTFFYSATLIVTKMWMVFLLLITVNCMYW